MDQMPPMKISKFSGQRFYRFNRKRRRSGTEVTDAEADGKMVKKDGGKADGEAGAKVETMETESAK
jgi:zinc finger RNA-binding protein